MHRPAWTLPRKRATAASDQIPPPLVDSPKCPRCSLVGICLPDETWTCRTAGDGDGTPQQRLLFDIGLPAAPTGRPSGEPRRLVAARDDLRPLYLNTQGLYVGKSGNVLKVKEKQKVVQEVRIGETCQVNLFGSVQISTQAVQTLCENEVPIAYFSMGGWFYGVTHGLGVRNVYLRRDQFRLADVPSFCLRLARTLVAGKIRNQRTMLQRNHIEPPPGAIAFLKCMMEDAERATSLESLLGIEGSAARVYFEHFAGMIKAGADEELGMRDEGRSATIRDEGSEMRDKGSKPGGSPSSLILHRRAATRTFLSTFGGATAVRRGTRSMLCSRSHTAC